MKLFGQVSPTSNAFPQYQAGEEAWKVQDLRAKSANWRLKIAPRREDSLKSEENAKPSDRTLTTETSCKASGMLAAASATATLFSLEKPHPVPPEKPSTRLEPKLGLRPEARADSKSARSVKPSW